MYKCGGTRCKTTCAASTDCAAGFYCTAPVCVPSKNLGAVCIAADECTSGICGGRCCPQACKCPQPSSGNLLKNAGFDADLGGWMVSGATWTRTDADNCPYSGAVKITFEGDMGEARQCVRLVQRGAHNLGVKVSVVRSVPGGDPACGVMYFASEDCKGNGFEARLVAGVVDMLNGWVTFEDSHVIPTTALSAEFSCSFFGTSATGAEALFDKPFFTPAPGKY